MSKSLLVIVTSLIAMTVLIAVYDPTVVPETPFNKPYEFYE